MRYYDLIYKEIANGINIKVVVNKSVFNYPNQYKRLVTFRAKNHKQASELVKNSIRIWTRETLWDS